MRQTSRARSANASTDYGVSACVTSNYRQYIYDWVCLGSGFSVVISVKEVNLSPLYSAVDHSHGNDNAAFGGDPSVVRQFCPYPVPLFYRLSSVVHQVTRAVPSTLHVTLSRIRIQCTMYIYTIHYTYTWGGYNRWSDRDNVRPYDRLVVVFLAVIIQ